MVTSEIQRLRRQDVNLTGSYEEIVVLGVA